MKEQFVSGLKNGEAVADVFVLFERSLARKRDGEPFLTVTLADRTGRIRGVQWDRAGETLSAVSTADYVRIRGNVSEYAGKPQVVITEMTAEAHDVLDPADFIPATNRNVDAMFDRLTALVTEKITRPPLKQLLAAFFEDAEFVQRFKTAPAGRQMHHGYLGGLLEHTLSMAILVDRLAGHYSGIDMDLLRTGAILHDVGKVREYTAGPRIDYTSEGRLLTHIIIGCQMIDEKIREIDGFPAEEAMLLKHLVVSHHGFREYGSPEPPKTVEAILLNFIDEIDAKVNGIREFIDKDATPGPWTAYHRLMGRQFYRGNPEPSETG